MPSVPFWQEVEDLIQSEIYIDAEGYLNGYMSGESWKAFLKTIHDEVECHLADYRDEVNRNGHFYASSLAPYLEERQKIRRAYLRNLAVLYRSAGKAYKILSG